MEPISSIPEPIQDGSPRLTQALTTSALKEALETAREHAGRLENQIQTLGLALSKVREEEQLLEKLISVRRGDAPGRPQRSRALERVMNRVVRSPAVATVVEILRETERPLHISELMRLLGDRNVRIPGAGRQANLIAGLRRDGRIVRPSRGMYGLAAWGLKDLTLKRKGRRKTRKGASKADRHGRAHASSLRGGEAIKDTK